MICTDSLLELCDPALRLKNNIPVNSLRALQLFHLLQLLVWRMRVLCHSQIVVVAAIVVGAAVVGTAVVGAAVVFSVVMLEPVVGESVVVLTSVVVAVEMDPRRE